MTPSSTSTQQSRGHLEALTRGLEGRAPLRLLHREVEFLLLPLLGEPLRALHGALNEGAGGSDWSRGKYGKFSKGTDKLRWIAPAFVQHE